MVPMISLATDTLVVWDLPQKTVPYFMPNKNMQWNVKKEDMNPTKSVAVNDLIKQVKKAELQKKGKQRNTKRDLTRQKVGFHCVFWKGKLAFITIRCPLPC
jgi:uncharacterized protein YfaQ (DUF2300 family)